jgi:hypothetical protein
VDARKPGDLELKIRALVILALGICAVAAEPQRHGGRGCPRCGWRAPVGRVVEVRDVGALEAAVSDARDGDTVLVAAGRYRLRRALTVATRGLTLRGATGNPADVVLEGPGMTDQSVGVGVSVNAAHVTIADLTIRDVAFHAIQVRGELGASHFTLHNARLVDAGQQLLKVSVSDQPMYADDGLVACSELGYTDHAPTSYTNGIDLIATRGWTIRDNRISRIRGPAAEGHAAGPAVLAWGGAENTVVERNVILDSYRSIALGLEPGVFRSPRHGTRGYDHGGGLVRHNVVINLERWADEGIEANAAAGVRIEHNTVLTDGRLGWSIGVRFEATPALVRNNLTTRGVLMRHGGRALLHGNVHGAERGWFVSVPGDLRLTTRADAAMDAGVLIDGVAEDFDRLPRVVGPRPDAGAFEYRGASRERR